MARTNGQNGQAGPPPAQRRAAPDRAPVDARALAPNTYPPAHYQEPSFSHPPQGYDPYRGQAQAPPSYPADYGSAEQAQGYGQPYGGQPQAQRPVPTPYYQPPVDPYAQNPALRGAQPGDPGLRGSAYDQWPAANAPAPQPGGHDPSGYDLGHYMPAGGQQPSQYARAPEQRPAPADPYSPQPYDAWAQENAASAQLPSSGQNYARAQAYAQPPPYAYPPQGQAQHLHDYGDQQAHYSAEPHFTNGAASNGAVQAYENASPDTTHDELDDAEHEAPRGGRMLTMMAALIGAVVLGSGVVYSYKYFLARPAVGATPVVKLDAKPSKTAPTDAGGIKFANADSKLLGRLDGTAGTASATTVADGPASDADGQGPRKVQTMVIGRDGQINVPAAGQPAPMTGVPGLTLVDGMRSGAPLAQAAPPAAAPPAASPPQAAAPPAAAQPVAPKIAKKAVAPKPAAVVALASPVAPDGSAALTPPAATASIPQPRVAAASAGYVAVLASKSSRMEALQTFADLQQRFGSVLQARIPDVQESNQAARGLGVVHRLVVGPPGSKEQADGLCTQLRSAGYADCWSKPY